MNSFNNYFTLYENTDPPPIKTEGYKEVQQNYENFLQYIPTQIQDQNSLDNQYLKDKENPFSIFIEAPTVINNQQKQSSAIKTNIVNTARQFVGTKYSWGGTTPSTGFDCSGLIYYAYKQNGINIPRTSKGMETFGTEVPSLQDVQEGDIICTSSSGKSGKHVKLVSRIDDGQIYVIEARGKKSGITETPLNNTSNITTIRRVYNNNSQNYIINYFMQKGLTKNQARGIYGNLMQESQGNIRATSSDGHNSYGLAQWTGDRKQRLFRMYGTNPTLNNQLDFIWWELNNTHKSALNELRMTSNTRDATKVFMDKFERPHKDYANFNRRLKYANSVV